MKKLLIFGCTGMLGSEVLKVFSNCKNFLITATYKDYRSLKQLKKNKLITHNIKFIKLNLEDNYEALLKKLMKSS